MTEENEMLLLLKELVGRIKTLESHVYHEDNVLMKSGLVKVNTPIPRIDNNKSGIPNDVGNKSWDELNQLVAKMEGR
jgi:hypothetical protein